MKSLLCILSIMVQCIVLLFLNSCASDAPFKFENSTIPEQLNDGWQTASPEDVYIDQTTLNQVYKNFVSEDHFQNAKSLLIVKNNRLIFETYCRNTGDRDRYGHVASVTKSVTSLMFGIVLAEGYIDSIGHRLYDIMPDKFPSDEQKQSITLEHLLTMRSGISFDNDDFSYEILAEKPDDPIKYILKKSTYAMPGETFYYRDCDPHLISYTIQRLTGKTLAQWAEERLFSPMGIENYYWEADHTGITTGPFGLYLIPRDMAKIGQLVLNHGQWQGVQLLDSSWISLSTRKQVDVEEQTEPYIYHYGYYWWIIPRWQAISAWGTGGNYIFIRPQQNLIIVMTSMADVDGDLFKQSLSTFEELITPLLE
jgi:CubicO group peptidase (beta-lactamase class C family)